MSRPEPPEVDALPIDVELSTLPSQIATPCRKTLALQLHARIAKALGLIPPETAPAAHRLAA